MWNICYWFSTLKIEEAVEEGIEEAEKIIEEEIEESEVEDEIFGAEKSSNSDKKDKEELSKEIINLINDNDEPSKDIDLGSVQEVWIFKLCNKMKYKNMNNFVCVLVFVERGSKTR